MDLVTLNNILNKHFKPNFQSADHAIYYPECVGVIQEDKMDAPNTNDYERSGKGFSGVAYRERTYKDQPFSMNIEYNEVVNRFEAILSNQSPYNIEDETAKTKGIGIGGEIGMNEVVDIIENQTDRDFIKFVKSMVFLSCKNIQCAVTIPNEGSSSFDISGICSRQFMFENPVYFEGWNHRCTVEEQSVPDDTVVVGEGCFYARRDAGDFTPMKKYFNGGNSGAFDPITGTDKRYDALVLYENTKSGHTDNTLLIVQGVAGGSPTIPTDTDIETAVDAVLAGARWVRVADVYIDELATFVVINTADIGIPTAAAYTFNKTALPFTAITKTDSWFLDDYLVYSKINGVHKRNTNNVASVTATALTFSSATSDMIEVGYQIAVSDMWNQLQL